MTFGARAKSFKQGASLFLCALLLAAACGVSTGNPTGRPRPSNPVNRPKAETGLTLALADAPVDGATSLTIRVKGLYLVKVENGETVRKAEIKFDALREIDVMQASAQSPEFLLKDYNLVEDEFDSAILELDPSNPATVTFADGTIEPIHVPKLGNNRNEFSGMTALVSDGVGAVQYSDSPTKIEFSRPFKTYRNSTASLMIHLDLRQSLIENGDLAVLRELPHSFFYPGPRVDAGVILESPPQKYILLNNHPAFPIEEVTSVSLSDLPPETKVVCAFFIPQGWTRDYIQDENAPKTWDCRTPSAKAAGGKATISFLFRGNYVLRFFSNETKFVEAVTPLALETEHPLYEIAYPALQVK